jgi:hypothetical protein
MNRDDRWVSKNFDKLMDLYGGRYVAVVNQRVVAVGPRPDTVENRARSLTGARVPSVVMVPRKESFRGGAFSAIRLHDFP